MYYIDRKLVKENARNALRANYWPIVGWMLLGTAIVAACGSLPGIGFVASIFITPVMTCGLCYFSYVTYSGEKAGAKQLFAGFSDKFMHLVGGYWWMALFTFLWSLLFVIPGIVKSIAYSMTPYILLDQPEISARDALKLSMDMTRGHKWEIFKMHLSFIGWDILCVITFGIVAIFYAGPYYCLTAAGYYYELKALYGRENGAAPEEEPENGAQVPAGVELFSAPTGDRFTALRAYDHRSSWTAWDFETNGGVGYETMLRAAQWLMDFDFAGGICGTFTVSEAAGSEEIERVEDVKQAAYKLADCEFLQREWGSVNVGGYSRALGANAKICLFNQTCVLRIFLDGSREAHALDDYAEKLMREAYSYECPLPGGGEPETAGLEFPDAPTWESANAEEAPGEPCEYEADEYEPDEPEPEDAPDDEPGDEK
ncbi:MAG: DUF975 family protein [Oscillospiraceae bacterium]|nr:DUF975 family protein [Oscillospiraceae bacterium]